MKNLLLLLLIAVSIYSCSKEDDWVEQTPPWGEPSEAFKYQKQDIRYRFHYSGSGGEDQQGNRIMWESQLIYITTVDTLYRGYTNNVIVNDTVEKSRPIRGLPVWTNSGFISPAFFVNVTIRNTIPAD